MIHMKGVISYSNASLCNCVIFTLLYDTLCHSLCWVCGRGCFLLILNSIISLGNQSYHHALNKNICVVKRVLHGSIHMRRFTKLEFYIKGSAMDLVTCFLCHVRTTAAWSNLFHRLGVVLFKLGQSECNDSGVPKVKEKQGKFSDIRKCATQIIFM